MALNPPTGSGGSGNQLGPVQNEFNTTLDRDNYATANPLWLAEYDANIRLMVKVGFTGDLYTRESLSWLLVTAEGEPVSVDPSVTTEVIVKYDPISKNLITAVKGDTLDGEAIATVPEVTTALGFFMEKSDYDPLLKESDVYDMDNMDESATAKILTDTERTKLTGVEALAEVNNISDADVLSLTSVADTTLHHHDSDRDRANHTGTQLAATISDFDSNVSSNSDVTANTAKNSYPSGDASKLAGIESGAEVNNISDINAVDLTDGGDTTLHTHPQLPNPHLSGYLSTNLTFNTTLQEKVIALDVTNHASNISLAAGVFTVATSGDYMTNITLQIKETSDPTFAVWLEVLPFATGVWELAGAGSDKCNISKLKTDQNWTMFFSDTIVLQADDKFRFVGTLTSGGTDKIELKSAMLVVSLGTITQHSAFVDVVRVSA
jgi:hypothetical protein